MGRCPEHHPLTHTEYPLGPALISDSFSYCSPSLPSHTLQALSGGHKPTPQPCPQHQPCYGAGVERVKGAQACPPLQSCLKAWDARPWLEGQGRKLEGA